MCAKSWPIFAKNWSTSVRFPSRTKHSKKVDSVLKPKTCSLIWKTNFICSLSLSPKVVDCVRNINTILQNVHWLNLKHVFSVFSEKCGHMFVGNNITRFIDGAYIFIFGFKTFFDFHLKKSKKIQDSFYSRFENLKWQSLLIFVLCPMVRFHFKKCRQFYV